MSSDLPTYNSEREMGLAWLRDVLNAMLEVSPVSYQQKKKTAPLLQRMPDWIMASWAQSLNIDYIGGCAKYPDMAEPMVARAMASDLAAPVDLAA